MKGKSNHIFRPVELYPSVLLILPSSHAVWLKKNLLLGEVSPTRSHTESRAAPVTPVKPVVASVPAVQTLSCRTWCVPQRTDTLSFSAWCSWTRLKCPDHLEGNKESNEKFQLRIPPKKLNPEKYPNFSPLLCLSVSFLIMENPSPPVIM